MTVSTTNQYEAIIGSDDPLLPENVEMSSKEVCLFLSEYAVSLLGCGATCIRLEKNINRMAAVFGKKVDLTIMPRHVHMTVWHPGKDDIFTSISSVKPSLFQNYLAAIVAESHPLASEQKVTLDMLLRYDLALPSPGLQARNSLDNMAGNLINKFKIKIELNEVNILLKLLREGKLVSVLAEATVLNETGVKAIPIEGEGCEMDGCVHTLRDTYRKRSMQEFIKILSSSLSVRARQNAWL